MKYVLPVFFFFITSAKADCRLNDGRGMVSVPEGRAISLFDEGKSLATHKVQDQDGLSTCYANATSAVLKSVLPNNPDVSYTHAGVQASTNGWRQNWRNRAGQYVNKDGNDFTSGGFLCETIAAMKTGGEHVLPGIL